MITLWHSRKYMISVWKCNFHTASKKKTFVFRKNEELLILQKEKQTEIIHAQLAYMKTPFDGFGESVVGHDDVQCTRKPWKQ